jgi:hypothetical protein
MPCQKSRSATLGETWGDQCRPPIPSILAQSQGVTLHLVRRSSPEKSGDCFEHLFFSERRVLLRLTGGEASTAGCGCSGHDGWNSRRVRR